MMNEFIIKIELTGSNNRIVFIVNELFNEVRWFSYFINEDKFSIDEENKYTEFIRNNYIK